MFLDLSSPDKKRDEERKALALAVENVAARVVREVVDDRIGAVLRAEIQRLIREELERIGISLEGGKLTIKGGGPF